MRHCAGHVVNGLGATAALICDLRDMLADGMLVRSGGVDPVEHGLGVGVSCGDGGAGIDFPSSPRRREKKDPP